MSPKMHCLPIELEHPSSKSITVNVCFPVELTNIVGRILQEAGRHNNPGLQDLLAMLAEDAPWTLGFKACLAYTWRNYWAAAHFAIVWRRVAPEASIASIDLLSKNCVDAIGPLPECLKWLNGNILADLAKCIAEVDRHARQHFCDGEPVEADICLQVANSLRHPMLTPLPVAHGLAQPATTLPAHYKVDPDAPYVSTYNDRTSPNKAGLARLICEGLGRSLEESKSFLEVGCYDGAVLRAIATRLGDTCRHNLLGIEPNHAALAFASKQYPELTLLEGDIDSLASGQFDAQLPAMVDCLILSCVCHIIDPWEFDQLLSWARTRVAMIAICDDILNLEGDVAYVCGPYMRHSFRKILASSQSR